MKKSTFFREVVDQVVEVSVKIDTELKVEIRGSRKGRGEDGDSETYP